MILDQQESVEQEAGWEPLQQRANLREQKAEPPDHRMATSIYAPDTPTCALHSHPSHPWGKLPTGTCVYAQFLEYVLVPQGCGHKGTWELVPLSY